MRFRTFSLFLIMAAASPARNLEISRPARPWEFMDAAGSRAAIFGHEDGVIEAWVFPLKIVKDLRLRFTVEGRAIPAESIARRIVSRAGAYAIVYAADEFQVTETFVVPHDDPGALIRLTVDAHSPVHIEVVFKRDFQLMWPASLGTAYMEWIDGPSKGFAFGADGQPYAAMLSSPDAVLLRRDYATNYSASADASFSLGTVNGSAERTIAIAASMQSREEALRTYARLIANAAPLIQGTEDFYEQYLSRTVNIEIPDRALQDAYDWSRLSMVKALVKNPFLGEGLAAGYGPSRGTYRPGFGWFFGRDSCWTSFALTAAGDFASARAALQFIGHFQRADGKIPHEISQSASLVPWFEKFQYGYASADATPLFIIAVQDYVSASGDLPFLQENWPRVTKAMSFLRSTFNAQGFPKNFGIGHGWVEGGPLLPVQTEFYHAGLAVQALRSLSILARSMPADSMNAAPMADSLQKEFQTRRPVLDRAFWLQPKGVYAFALDQTGRKVDQPSVLAAVPMWFGLLDAEHSRAMLQQLADESHASDWGMRILSSTNPLYHPAGYHFGSVWPLFTGWASVAEYRYHQVAAAFANLKANANLALDGAGGNATEVLSGASYAALSTASPHQTWSAAMVVSPLMRGLFGFENDAQSARLRMSPHIPAQWDNFELRNLPAGAGLADISFRREEDRIVLTVNNRGTAPLEFEFAPAFAPCAAVTAAEYNGTPVRWTEDKTATDWHARFVVSIPPGTSSLTLHSRNDFGYAVPYEAPLPGATSSNLKVISETWSRNAKELKLLVSGRQGSSYRIDLFGTARLASVSGAERAPGDKSIRVVVPGTAHEYAPREAMLTLE